MNKLTLTPAEIIALKQAHRACKDKRAADRIKAVYSLGMGFSLEDVVSILMLDEETLRNYVKRYQAGGINALNSYRKHPKTKTEKLADDIADLAQSISVPLSVMTGNDAQTIEQLEKARVITKTQLYIPFEEDNLALFANKLDARQAIARFLGKPLAELLPQQLNVINQILEETLNKEAVESRVRQFFTLSLHQALNKE